MRHCSHFLWKNKDGIDCIGGSVTSTAASGAVGSGAQVDANALGHPADVLDMPVDPNEPTYCLCHQVSYGEMIGCDNPDVSICINTYLFHFCPIDYIVKKSGLRNIKDPLKFLHCRFFFFT